MLLRNTLVRPEAFEVPDFETLYTEHKQRLVDLIREGDPEQAGAVAETLNSESELLTKFIRHNVLLYQQALRAANERYRQTLPDFATDSNLDAVVKRLDLVRRENESDDALRERYYLSLAAPARGTRLGYLFQARSLGENPALSLRNTEQGFAIDYVFDETSVAAKIKTVNAVSPAPGQVDIIFLAFDEKDNDAIQKALERYLNKEKLLTDKVTVLPAKTFNYALMITLGFYDEPDSSTIVDSAETAFKDYLASREFIGATVEPTDLIALGKAAGAKRVTVMPTEPLETDAYSVPVNTNLLVETALI